MSTVTKAIMVGLPNTGKTTLFNQITGACFKVGNWSGVTVSAHKVTRKYQGKSYDLVDLPGILNIYDRNEQLDYELCREQISSADVIINVIDGRFLQRDLVLTLQLLCYQKPIIAVVTHMGEVSTDSDRVLAAIPCQAVIAEELQLFELLNKVELAKSVDIDSIIEWPIGFGEVWRSLSGTPVDKLKSLCAASGKQLLKEKAHEEPADVLIAEGFYQTAAGLVNRSGCRLVPGSYNDWIDRYLLHPFWGVPIFLLVMYWVFVLTIGFGGALGELLSGHLALFVNSLPRTNLLWVVLHSVGAGLATGMGFIPVLGVMYGLLAVLEQSGYLSRVVLLTDGLMRPIGLSGHGFIPMILGFGCNVPAVMATRAISGYQQRVLTAMMLPFMSCSARLSIFAVFAVSFFPRYGALVILGLYALGVFIAILSVALVRYILSWDDQAALSIHLAQYQYPDWSMIRKSVGLKLKSFSRRTMGYIVVFAAIFSVFSHVDIAFNPVEVDQSMMTVFGQKTAHYFGFMGLGPENWQAVVALISGVVAKEIVLTTMNSLYQAGVVLEAVSLHDSIALFSAFGDKVVQMFLQLFVLDWSASGEIATYQQYFTNHSALAYMVFILLYFPCVSTLVVLQQECGLRWAIASFVWTTVIAVWVSKVVYWGAWISDFALVLFLMVLAYYIKQKIQPATQKVGCI